MMTVCPRHTVWAVAAGLLLVASCSRAPSKKSTSRESAIELSCRAQGGSGPGVRWIEALTEKDQKMNARWCTVVGPPTIELLTDSEERPTLDSLAVISWNMYVGGGGVVELVKDLRKGELTGGRPVDHFVLLLQEAYREGDDVPVNVIAKYYARRSETVPPSGNRVDIVEASQALGLALFYVPSMRNGRPGAESTEEDKGNAILSTLPLSGLTAIELPFELTRRVAVAATINGQTTTGTPWGLRVCSAHLDHFSRLARVYASGGSGRGRQAEALLQSLPESPGVLGADLNTWGSRYMESAFIRIRESFSQPDSLDHRVTAVRKFLPDKRIDYLFFRLPDPCTGRYTRLDKRYGSDHFPLLGWVQLACSAE